MCVCLLEFLVCVFSLPMHCGAKCDGRIHVVLLSAGDETKKESTENTRFSRPVTTGKRHICCFTLA